MATDLIPDRNESTGGEQPERLDLRSMDVTEEKRQELLRLFPEARTEGGRIDFDRLQLALGQMIDVGRERYGMTWPGKADCFKTIQTPSLGTLLPSREESVNFDTTENLIIEGDNLEVLKLLQKSYLGKVKMIYIDPPYNTGNDFIYPDDYTESLQTYLEYTGQVDAEGKKFSTNTEADGRFHSKWLDLMYPRLYLARNLLCKDGVVLISIDDSEVENLRRICGELFGEEALVACLVWEKGRKNDAKFFSVGHEYVLVYARSIDRLRETGTIWREEKPGAREIWDEYLRLRRVHDAANDKIEHDLQAWFLRLPKTHPSKKWARYRRVDDYGPWRDRDISWPGGGGPRYDVLHPKTRQPCKVPDAGWRYTTTDEMQRQIKLGLVVFREDHTEPPFRKAHLRPVKGELDDSPVNDEEADSDSDLATQVRGTYFYKQSQGAVKHLRALMGAKIFDNPKDHEEIARLIKYVAGDADHAIVLDFFAGSGTTAHAVLDLNEQDGGNRKFILVQLPEPSGREDLRTIADIAKERVRRVIKKLDDEESERLDLAGGKKQDRGFRVFKLAESNMKTWKADEPKDPDALAEQLELHVDHILPERTQEDIFFEILIKSGYPLTVRVETLLVAEKKVFSVAGGALLVCLEKDLTIEVIRAMAERKPERIVCLDAGFAGNDQLKANAVQIFKTLHRTDEAEASSDVTAFRTV
jgi:adenine-specific DNA-methyltransferase